MKNLPEYFVIDTHLPNGEKQMMLLNLIVDVIFKKNLNLLNGKIEKHQNGINYKL